MCHTFAHELRRCPLVIGTPYAYHSVSNTQRKKDIYRREDAQTRKRLSSRLSRMRRCLRLTLDMLCDIFPFFFFSVGTLCVCVCQARKTKRVSSPCVIFVHKNKHLILIRQWCENCFFPPRLHFVRENIRSSYVDGKSRAIILLEMSE